MMKFFLSAFFVGAAVMFSGCETTQPAYNQPEEKETVMFSGSETTLPAYDQSEAQTIKADTEQAVVKTEKPQIEYNLNYYNTYWDDFSGALEKLEVYHYENKNYPNYLRFKVLQVIDAEKGMYLFTRWGKYDTIQGKVQEACTTVTLLIITTKCYADGAVLQAGDYICLGTVSYPNDNQDQKTIYFLSDRETLQKELDKKMSKEKK